MNFATRKIERRNLVLPDGTIAEDLRLLPLQAELGRLAVPGITPEMGKQQLLDRYAAHVAEVIETLPPRSHAGRTSKTIAEIVVRQAAELIGQRAATPMASEAPQVFRPAFVSMKV